MRGAGGLAEVTPGLASREGLADSPGMALRWFLPSLLLAAFFVVSCAGGAENGASRAARSGSGNGGSEEASSGSPDHGSGDGADPAGSPGTPDAMDPSDEEAEAVTATAATASPTPIRTPTPAPTQTPTATPIPTAVTVTVSGGCEFSPENAMVVRGGTVAFVNAAGHELEITIFPPGEEGDAVGQGIEPGEASAALPIEQRGVSKAVCEGPDDGEFGNMRITAVL